MNAAEPLPPSLSRAFIEVVNIFEPLDLFERRQILRALELSIADAEAEARRFLRPHRHRKGNRK